MSDNDEILRWLDKVTTQMSAMMDDPTPTSVSSLWSTELTLAMVHDAIKGAVFILDGDRHDTMMAQISSLLAQVNAVRSLSMKVKRDQPTMKRYAKDIFDGTQRVKMLVNLSEIYLFRGKPSLSSAWTSKSRGSV